MATLQERLDGMKAASAKRIPPEALAVVKRSIEGVLADGLLERAAKVGAQAPDWSLKAPDGTNHTLAGALAKGRLVLSFYRGLW